MLRHAEVLEDGELGVRPLRTAEATDAYLVAGPQEVVLEPALTLHGFRYAEVTGVPGLRAEDLHAVVIGSDLRRTGWFSSSHELLNRFHENVVWGMRGNFVDVPTDCPQRDERLGWTGDIQVFSPTAAFLYDSAGLLTGWLKDLAAEQQKDGSVPFVIPDVLRRPGPATAAWGDAATIVPWVLYRRTGDLGLLERQLPSMRAWVDRVAELAGPDRIWAGGFQFGDWLDPAAPPESPFQARADPDVIATAHLARSAEIVARAAELLGDAAGCPALRPARRAGPCRVRPRVRDHVRPGARRRRDDVRAGVAVVAAAVGGAAAPRRAAAGRPRAGGRLPDRHRLRRHAADDRRADRRGRARAGVPAAVADRLPVVALPGDDGRDDRLGTLGQHAAGRLGQPRRDDVVQPLRARRGRRLAAPPGRRAGTGRAGLPAAARAAGAELPSSPLRRPGT
nr:hypothetical protein GCM10020092_050020 [Actinoplanes digitatis]